MTKNLAFWKNGARLTSAIVFKGAVPKWCRLYLFKNPRYKKGGSQPSYIGHFVPTAESDKAQDALSFSVFRKNYSDDNNL